LATRNLYHIGLVSAVCLIGLAAVAHLALVGYSKVPAVAASAPSTMGAAGDSVAAAMAAPSAQPPTPSAEPADEAAGDGPTAPAPAKAAAASAPEALGSLWKDTAGLVAPLQAASRSLLLGTRDPNGPSCIEEGTSRGVMVEKNGGLGTGTAFLLASTMKDRSSPQAEYQWHQTTFRPLLVRLRDANRSMYARALRLVDQARRLADGLEAATAWPTSMTEVSLAPPQSWLTYCAYQLDQAAGRRDLASARVWAREFHAAAFTLADLHRWVDYLIGNHLDSLDFQAKCEELYLSADINYEATNRIMYRGIISYPGGQLGLSTIYNYLEVERQAEGLFGLPLALRPKADGTVPPLPGHTLPPVPAAVMMPTNARPAFLRLRECLSPANRALWDEAALAPFDRSYLANMLFRLSRAKVLEAVEEVLARFEQANPHPTRADLMDVIFYRGGAPGGGRIWADRFDPRLMKVAGTLGGTNEQVLLGAQRYTRAVFGCWDDYEQNDTLAQALDEGKFDCIGAADMIGALYRNAGRTGFYSVRWCAGHQGHTLAAALLRNRAQPVIGIVDGLDSAAAEPDLWPQAYANGHVWPRGYPGPRPAIYAVELFARGLDNYVWVEGYIMRGPSAGTLVRVPAPHLPPLPPVAATGGVRNAMALPAPAASALGF